MTKKERKVYKQIEKLAPLVGVDLCACNGPKCDGVCRDNHTKNGVVNCVSLYKINISEFENRLKKIESPNNVEVKTAKERNREKFFKKTIDRI